MGLLNKVWPRRKSTSLPSPHEASGPLPECCPIKVSAGDHDISASRRTLTHRPCPPFGSRVYDESGAILYDIEASAPHTSGTTTTATTHPSPDVDGGDARFIFKSRHRPGSQVRARSKVAFFDDSCAADDTLGDTGTCTFTASDTDVADPIALRFVNVYTNQTCSLTALRPDLWPTTLDIYLLVHHHHDDGTHDPPLLVGKFTRSRAANGLNGDSAGGGLDGNGGSIMEHRVEFSGNISVALMTMFVVGYVQTFGVFMNKVGAQASKSYTGRGNLQNFASMGGVGF